MDISAMVILKMTARSCSRIGLGMAFLVLLLSTGIAGISAALDVRSGFVDAAIDRVDLQILRILALALLVVTFGFVVDRTVHGLRDIPYSLMASIGRGPKWILNLLMHYLVWPLVCMYIVAPRGLPAYGQGVVLAMASLGMVYLILYFVSGVVIVKESHCSMPPLMRAAALTKGRRSSILVALLCLLAPFVLATLALDSVLASALTEESGFGPKSWGALGLQGAVYFPFVLFLMVMQGVTYHLLLAEKEGVEREDTPELFA